MYPRRKTCSRSCSRVSTPVRICGNSLSCGSQPGGACAWLPLSGPRQSVPREYAKPKRPRHVAHRDVQVHDFRGGHGPIHLPCRHQTSYSPWPRRAARLPPPEHRALRTLLRYVRPVASVSGYTLICLLVAYELELLPHRVPTRHVGSQHRETRDSIQISAGSVPYSGRPTRPTIAPSELMQAQRWLHSTGWERACAAAAATTASKKASSYGLSMARTGMLVAAWTSVGICPRCGVEMW